MPIHTHRSRSLAHASRNRLPFTGSAAARHLAGAAPGSSWAPSSALAKALLEEEVALAKGASGGVGAQAGGRGSSDSEESGSGSEGEAEVGKAGAVEVNLADLAKAKRSFSRSVSSDFEVIPRHKPVLALPDDAFAPATRGPAPVDFSSTSTSSPSAHDPPATPGDEWEVLDFDAEGDEVVDAAPIAPKAASKRSWARIVG